MGLQSLCCSFYSSKINLCNHPSSSVRTVSAVTSVRGAQRFVHQTAAKSCSLSGLTWAKKQSSLPMLKAQASAMASSSNSNGRLQVSGKDSTGVPVSKLDGVEPFRGKSGSISFYGVTHHMVEERKLQSTPFNEGSGSLLWVLAPVVLILSLILPPLFFTVNAPTGVDVFSELRASLSCEAIFYVGLACFCYITNRVQRPYLQFSAKRWALITGLRGFMSTLFFSVGLKVIAPIGIAYVNWPVLGPQTLVAIAPFLLGILAQSILQRVLYKDGSSCWPVLPIIFEVYRIYQLTKAAHFIEGLMFAMKDSLATPEVMERTGALVSMLVTFQGLGLVCLWSLLTFLLRLFPSRPVAEKY